MTWAISSGWAARLRGTLSVFESLDKRVSANSGEEWTGRWDALVTADWSSGGNAANMAVSVAPGWMQFERMPEEGRTVSVSSEL